MIASLSGTVLACGTDWLIVEVGGVGLKVSSTPTVCGATAIGDVARLATTLVVREDSLTLFGFLAEVDRDVFESLQSVSGIGPRIALAALATYSGNDLRAIVANKDEAALTRISGIGKKGAQRLIIELEDKLGPPTASGLTQSTAISVAPASWAGQVTEALVGLGWSNREAESAVAAVAADVRPDDEVSVADMLARVLREMNRR